MTSPEKTQDQAGHSRSISLQHPSPPPSPSRKRAELPQVALEFTPFFENVKESWEKRDHPNMLFLFYEDSLRDLATTVKRVAKFLVKPVSEEQVKRLCDHLVFNNFKKNKSVNMVAITELNVELTNSKNSFIRKGKAG
ncbi:unnamed protein product [Diatraea saccharalis]|uniref:Sulfotransferase domain-containing protein n=1 Tax=Diatraea saccharalis TaxID=40085 RepID=A0A9N9QV29_9NEOP|nr:unnamed protein product [Diatraea saccharalis]